jgi:hypothetical protein
MTITRAGQILQRLAAVGFPTIAARGTCWSGEMALVRLVTDAFPIELDEIERQLRPLEERKARVDTVNREEDRRSAERYERDRAAQRAALRDLLGE